MKLNRYYEQHINKFLESMQMDFLQGKTVLISGVTGMIGSAIADALCMAGKNIRVLGMGRAKERAVKRFAYPWFTAENFRFIEHDVINKCFVDVPIDFVIHAASPAYPAVFAKYPVETMTANFLGTLNLLELAKDNQARFLFVSSGEIYGEIDKETKEEQDYGFIDSMQPRSCYPNSKRAAETLCSAYADEHGVEAVVVRLSHVYGPTMTDSDNRVSSDFIRKAKLGQNLILHSTGTTVRSYTYVLDAVSGIICALQKGKNGEAYNIADENKVVSIRQLAEITAKAGNVSFTIDVPDTADKGTSSISRQVMSGEKLRMLGWKCKFDFTSGVDMTLNCMSTKYI
jgi:nucleoside-diphosphate-sugar epimerase